MKREVGLEALAGSLKHTHLKLNLNFLIKLLKDASNSDYPQKSEEFCRGIKCQVNKTKKISTTIYGWMRGYRTVPLSKLIKIVEFSSYKWGDVEKNLISIKAGIRRGEIPLKFPITIDEKLGSIIGHILGDGSIDKRFHSLFYSNSDLALLKEFSYSMKKKFSLEPRIWVQEKTSFDEKTKWMKRVNNLDDVPRGHSVGLFYPKICTDILYTICGKFAEGKTKKITKEIKGFDKEFKKGLIKAFFDDECSINSKNHTLRLHQDRKDILEDIKRILGDFDIDSNVVRSYNKRGKLRYYFNINGFKNYYGFFKIIGCTAPKKKREFRLLINKVKNSKQFKKKYSL